MNRCKHPRTSYKGDVDTERMACVFECCDCGTLVYIHLRPTRSVEAVPNGTVLTDGVRTRTVAA